MRAGVGRRERAGGRAGAALRALHAAGCSPHVRCARLPSPRSTCGTRPSLLLRPRAAAEGPATRFPRGCGGERPCPRADSPGLRSCPSLQGSCWAHGVLLPLSIITTPGLQGERGRGGGATRAGNQGICGVDRPVEKTLKKTRDLGSPHRTRLPVGILPVPSSCVRHSSW